MRLAKRFRFLPRACFAVRVRTRTRFAQKVRRRDLTHVRERERERVRVYLLLCESESAWLFARKNLVRVAKRFWSRPGGVSLCVSTPIRTKSAPPRLDSSARARVRVYLLLYDTSHTSEFIELEACIVRAAARTRTWSAAHGVVIASGVKRSCRGVVQRHS